MKTLFCTAPKCRLTARILGLCGLHFKEWQRGGTSYSPRDPGPNTKYFGQPCKIDGCSDPAESNDMCGKHDQRVRRYGDSNYVTSKEQHRLACRAVWENVPAKPTSYKKWLGRHEHRVVAERMLGRPLVKGEIVHHKDGNKHNNSPDNLEVMTQSEHMREHMDELIAARRAALARSK